MRVAIHTMTSYRFCPITWPSSRRQNTKDAYIKYLITEVSEPIHTYKFITIKTIVQNTQTYNSDKEYSSVGVDAAHRINTSSNKCTV